MKTTYKIIKSFDPCQDGWKLLIKNTNSGMDMDKEIDIMDILKSNGIEHAIWALRCCDYKDWCLFAADVAELAITLFESVHHKDKRPRKAIQAIRDYRAGKISSKELVKANNDACAAASNYEYYVSLYDSYTHAIAIAADNSNIGNVAVAVAVDAAVRAIIAYARNDASDTNDGQKKWQGIEQLFIKHFGDE